MHVIGLVSDTHGLLDSVTLEALQARPDIHSIIHSGDVSDKNHRRQRLSAKEIIHRLEEATPGNRVIAIRGNVDDESATVLPPTQVITIGEIKILVVHICGFPPKVSPDAQQLIQSISPHVVVFGHSHVPGVQCHNNILYVNPGSAGPRRFKLPRCMAFLSLLPTGVIEVEFIPLGTLPQDIIRLPEHFRCSIFKKS